MKKTLISLALMAVSAQASALTLTTGDIAFTGFNADKNYWSLVALTDLAANTQIFFSDNEWNGTAFTDTNEHTLLWNTGANTIGAGTVVLFTEVDNTSPTPDTITASYGTLALAAGGGTNLGLSATEDTLYAYLGTPTAPTTFLTAISSEVKGSAGYVAIERVTGTLHGKKGSFVLQHSGTMTRGAPGLSVTVVPDSGTDELEGLVGSMAIIIEDKKHSYRFDYTL